MKAQAEIIEDRADVGELIERQKFAGIILDGKLIGRRRLELVHRIRRSPSNSKTPIVLILDPQDTGWLMDAYRAGVAFSVIRPLGEKKLNQLLTLAGGSMLAEQRSYIRLPASLPVRFLAGKRSGQGQSINISRSGLLFRTSDPGDRNRWASQDHCPTWKDLAARFN
jgi:CheY-like chemotaxis protein